MFYHFKSPEADVVASPTIKPQSFASLRAKGWIDIDHPIDLKLLQFIAKRSDSTDEVIEKVRVAELEAITAWITASVKDPDSLNVPLLIVNDLQLDRELILHSRKDHVTDRFSVAIWSQLERCANCHSPDCRINALCDVTVAIALFWTRHGS